MNTSLTTFDLPHRNASQQTQEQQQAEFQNQVVSQGLQPSHVPHATAQQFADVLEMTFGNEVPKHEYADKALMITTDISDVHEKGSKMESSEERTDVINPESTIANSLSTPHKDLSPAWINIVPAFPPLSGAQTSVVTNPEPPQEILQTKHIDKDKPTHTQFNGSTKIPPPIGALFNTRAQDSKNVHTASPNPNVTAADVTTKPINFETLTRTETQPNTSAVSIAQLSNLAKGVAPSSEKTYALNPDPMAAKKPSKFDPLNRQEPIPKHADIETLSPTQRTHGATVNVLPTTSTPSAPSLTPSASIGSFAGSPSQTPSILTQLGQTFAQQVPSALSGLGNTHGTPPQPILVQLSPAELGQVHIHFKFKGSKDIAAHIVAQSAETRLVLQNNSDFLTAHLKQNGFDNADISFGIKSDKSFFDTLSNGSGNNSATFSHADTPKENLIKPKQNTRPTDSLIFIQSKPSFRHRVGSQAHGRLDLAL